MEKTIHEAINAVMNEVGYVKKSKAANLNYSFAGEAALISAIRPSIVEHGIYMSVDSISDIRREAYTTAKGTAMVNTIIQAVVKFTHVSGDSITVAAVGEGSDAGDKSANKAMTGLYKYALRQTFCIETGDDPDKHASEERKFVSDIDAALALTIQKKDKSIVKLADLTNDELQALITATKHEETRTAAILVLKSRGGE
jgi:hypothetical protein